MSLQCTIRPRKHARNTCVSVRGQTAYALESPFQDWEGEYQ